ncbi:hypothetical protein GCM10023238_13840 [Streptomyces heliomycini]
MAGLTFVHWRAPADVAPLLPRGTCPTHPGRCHVRAVASRSGCTWEVAAPAGVPELELPVGATNVRLYVGGRARDGAGWSSSPWTPPLIVVASLRLGFRLPSSGRMRVEHLDAAR